VLPHNHNLAGCRRTADRASVSHWSYYAERLGLPEWILHCASAQATLRPWHLAPTRHVRTYAVFYR